MYCKLIYTHKGYIRKTAVPLGWEDTFKDEGDYWVAFETKVKYRKEDGRRVDSDDDYLDLESLKEL